MLFNSLAFAIFLPIVLAGYYVLSRRAQNYWLLAASWLFYAWWDVRFLNLLGVCTLVNFYCGIRIAESPSPRRRKLYLAAGVVTCMAILAFFKYFGFFMSSAQTVLAALGLRGSSPAWQIVLPVGISFYTFQTLSYTIDVYRRKMEPCYDVVDFALFVSFFPQLVAGSIERAANLLPQFQQRRTVRWEQLREGALLILIGYFKKVGVADALAGLVDVRFSNPALCSGGDLLLALYLFSVQIYCDFSGYSDIARGCGKLVGIDLMVNFNQPYFSSSVTEFWRRWHISLSTWLRDYLYIPLGGNRHGAWKTYRNLMLTMLLGGLWHGASWRFVVWGGLHGLYLAVHRSLGRRPLRGASEPPPATPAARGAWVVKVLLTFHLVALTWIFFRADTFALAWAYLKGIVTWQRAGGIDPMSWLSPRVLSLVGLLVLIDAYQYVRKDHTAFLRWAWPLRALTWACVVIVLVTMGGIGVQIPFIYFQF